MQVDRGVERRQPLLFLPGPDRLGEEGIELPHVERIAAGESLRRPDEAVCLWLNGCYLKDANALAMM